MYVLLGRLEEACGQGARLRGSRWCEPEAGHVEVFVDSDSGRECARFELGRTVITANAASMLASEEVLQAIGRHARGEWGELCEEDRKENEHSLREGFRLLSAYRDRKGVRFWVITEADRSVTTVLLPEDY